MDEPRLTDSEIVAWIRAAFVLFADVFSDETISRETIAPKCAAGAIAYALHNMPGTLASDDGWGRTWDGHHYWATHHGPPVITEIARHFFASPPEPIPLLCPARELPNADVAVAMFRDVFQTLRSWWCFGPDQKTVDDILLRNSTGWMDEFAPISCVLSESLVPYFDRWVAGGGFDRDAFAAETNLRAWSPTPIPD